jgi:hypothetical protein
VPLCRGIALTVSPLPLMLRLASALSKRAAVISSHIKMVYGGIAELMQLQPQQQRREASIYD